MSGILVVNSGSSSIKYQLISIDDEHVVASGLIERIGEWEIPDHTVGFEVVLSALKQVGALESHPPIAIGHRVVHGGARFTEPTLLSAEVVTEIDKLTDLAPLHNPGAVQGIRAALDAYPDVPQVAVFDTAFHTTLVPAVAQYAIDAHVAAEYGVRRYGFHGTSHQYVSRAAAEFLGRPLDSLKQIVLHLGNGASVCAVDGGVSVETSMGMTPLEGLVMGTRSGDIDAGVLFHLGRVAGFSLGELDALLNKRSGLLGMTGTGDMRDVQKAAASGDPAAILGLDVYVHRVRHYVGAYLAQLGGADVISFTAGVGENNALVRGRALAGLERLGISIDPARNEAPSQVARVISTDDSAVTVLVVPTDEELEIARQTMAVAAAL